MTEAAPAGYLDIEPLARSVRSSALTDRDRHCARSLVEQWSRREGELTRRQWRMAAVLARKAGTAPEPGPSGYVPVKAPESRWWFNTSSHRQACRGRKSGIARRYATRDRDARIARWINRGKYSIRQVARHVGLSTGAVSAIASRARGGKGYWRGPEKYHPPDTRRRRVFSQPSLRTCRPFSPFPPAAAGSRNVALFTSLSAWTGLQEVKRLPDAAVRAEAERLNLLFSKPLRPKELKRIVRSVCKSRSRFAGPYLPIRHKATTRTGQGFGDSLSVTNPGPATDPQSRKSSSRNDCDGVTASPSPFPTDTIAIELIERADKARRRAAARDSNGSSPDNPGRH